MKDMQTPNFHDRCEMCWNEWKIIFSIFIFLVMIDFVLKILRKLNNLDFLIDHISETENRKNRQIDFQHIPLLSRKYDRFWFFLTNWL